jgi:hypothetical protein
LKKLITIFTFAFLIFAGLTVTVGKSIWLWSLFSVIPSFIFPFLVLISILILLKSLNKKKILFYRIFVSISLIIFTSSLAISDINFRAFVNIFTNNEVSADSISIFNFNTEFWETQDNLDNLYTFLQKQNADIYNLQEFFAPEEIEREEFEKESVLKLQEYFPNYEIIFQGELISMSSL